MVRLKGQRGTKMSGTFPLPMKHQMLVATMISIIITNDSLNKLCVAKQVIYNNNRITVAAMYLKCILKNCKFLKTRNDIKGFVHLIMLCHSKFQDKYKSINT